jgi:hypothetical protein
MNLFEGLTTLEEQGFRPGRLAKYMASYDIDDDSSKAATSSGFFSAKPEPAMLRTTSDPVHQQAGPNGTADLRAFSSAPNISLLHPISLAAIPSSSKSSTTGDTTAPLIPGHSPPSPSTIAKRPILRLRTSNSKDKGKGKQKVHYADESQPGQVVTSPMAISPEVVLEREGTQVAQTSAGAMLTTTRPTQSIMEGDDVIMRGKWFLVYFIEYVYSLM